MRPWPAEAIASKSTKIKELEFSPTIVWDF